MPNKMIVYPYHLQIKHLLALIVPLALILVTLAPAVRVAIEEGRIWMLLMPGIELLLAVITLVVLFLSRGRALRKVGIPYQRFQKKRNRLAFWLIAGILVIACAAFLSSDLQVLVGDASTENYNEVVSPQLMMATVWFFAVAGWWRVVPSTIEICPQGFISAGLTSYTWSDVQRFTFSQSSDIQLNLFFQSRTVLNVSVENSAVEPLKQIFSEKIQPRNELT